MQSEATDSGLLASLVQRLANDTTYMAHVFALYKSQEGFDDADLGAYLNAFPEQIIRLALCKRPEPDAPDFADQIRLLGDFTLIDEALLAHVIRQVDSLTHLSQSPMLANPAPNTVLGFKPFEGTLAAARDRDEIPKDSGDTEGSNENKEK